MKHEITDKISKYNADAAQRLYAEPSAIPGWILLSWGGGVLEMSVAEVRALARYAEHVTGDNTAPEVK